MKTVVFVCLLSLSMCLSQPTTNSEAPPTQLTPTDHKTETTPNVDKTTQNSTSNETPKIDPTGNPKETTTKPKESTPVKPVENNKTDGKNPEKLSTEQTPTSTVTKPANETKSIDAKNATVPVHTDKKKGEGDKTTVHPAVVTPTVAPNVTEKPTVLARGFDGASFVGGIILTLGLLAIGFMGFKYYKNQTERNYHTL